MRTLIVAWFVISIWHNCVPVLADDSQPPPASSTSEAKPTKQMLVAQLMDILHITEKANIIDLLVKNTEHLKLARRERFNELVREEFKGVDESTTKQIASLYDKYYTEAELQDLIAFYQSPTGKTSLEIEPKIDAELKALIESSSRKKLDRVLTLYNEEEVESEHLKEKLTGTKEIITDSRSADAVKVLFIGNSLTYFNNLPAVFAQFIRSGLHKESKIWMISADSRLLMDHWGDRVAQDAIGSATGWNYVILQGQSAESYLLPDLFNKAATNLVARIKSKGSRSILFETWAEKNESTIQSKISSAYTSLGKDLGVPVVPVGDAWFFASKKDHTLALYRDDDHHPSEKGTYFSACAFYEYLFGKDPHGLPFTITQGAPGKHDVVFKLTKASAQELQDLAWNFYQMNEKKSAIAP